MLDDDMLQVGFVFLDKGIEVEVADVDARHGIHALEFLQREVVRVLCGVSHGQLEVGCQVEMAGIEGTAMGLSDVLAGAVVVQCQVEMVQAQGSDVEHELMPRRRRPLGRRRGVLFRQGIQ